MGGHILAEATLVTAEAFGQVDRIKLQTISEENISNGVSRAVLYDETI
jgi:hypothetical protein